LLSDETLPFPSNKNYNYTAVYLQVNNDVDFQTILGDDMYIFTRLNKVYDAMPATVSHSNKLFPRPPSPFDGK